MDIKFRAAHSADLTALVTMLANDQLGAAREDASSPLNPKYLAMFEVIENDLNNELMMVELEGQRVGALKFYQRLGFEATHEGFKLSLAD